MPRRLDEMFAVVKDQQRVLRLEHARQILNGIALRGEAQVQYLGDGRWDVLSA